MFRPRRVCNALLAALDASEGRRRSRKRDQTPDAIGLAAKRALLERVVREDPEPQAFEDWLLHYAQREPDPGAASAMALAVLEEWRLAHATPQFAAWLEGGAPSDDARGAAGGA
jgi:hypothetical protein